MVTFPKYDLKPSHWWTCGAYTISPIEDREFIIPDESISYQYKILNKYGGYERQEFPERLDTPMIELSRIDFDKPGHKQEVLRWCDAFGLLGIFFFRNIFTYGEQYFLSNELGEEITRYSRRHITTEYFQNCKNGVPTLYSKSCMSMYSEPLDEFIKYAKVIKAIAEVSSTSSPPLNSERYLKRWLESIDGAVNSKFVSILNRNNCQVVAEIRNKSINWRKEWQVNSLYSAMFLARLEELLREKIEYNDCMNCGNTYERRINRKEHYYCSERCRNTNFYRRKSKKLKDEGQRNTPH
jgi:endogenous inhibitor of DNA gyrase (YacG/DUF329 family)